MSQPFRRYGPHRNLNESIVYSPDQYNQLKEIVGTEDRAQNRQDVAKTEMTRIATCLNVDTAIEDEAARIYQHIIQTNLVNNFSIGALIAAAMYTACRKRHVPRSLSDVDASLWLLVDPDGDGEIEENRWPYRQQTYGNYRVLRLARRRTTHRIYNRICDKLGQTYLPPNPKDFVQRYGNELELDVDVLQFAQVAIDLVGEEAVAGYEPNSIAAGAIYYAAEEYNLNLIQRDIEIVACTSTTTLTNARNRLRECLSSTDS